MDSHQSLFGEWWAENGTILPSERFRHFDSLTRDEQTNLKRSFFDERWDDLFYRNEIDEVLDLIKHTYSIDLIDLRIKAIWFRRIFLIERHIWDDIEDRIRFYEGYYDVEKLFDGLSIRLWGENNGFFRITGV